MDRGSYQWTLILSRIGGVETLLQHRPPEDFVRTLAECASRTAQMSIARCPPFDIGYLKEMGNRINGALFQQVAKASHLVNEVHLPSWQLQISRTKEFS